MAIRELLAGKSLSEQSEIKTRELAKLSSEQFSRAQWTLTITDGPRVVMVGDTPALELTVAVTRNGVLVPIDGHLRFMNPPVMVPDGTFRTVTNAFGQDLQVANFVENPRAALRQMVLDAVMRQVRG